MANGGIADERLRSDAIVLELREKIRLTKGKERERNIASLGLRLMELVDVGDVCRESAMYVLGGYVLDPSLSGPLAEAVGVAAELELPDHHVGGDISEMWVRLKLLLKQSSF